MLTPDIETVAVYVINGLLLILAYFIKSSIDDMKDEFKSLKVKHTLLETEVNRLHILLPTNYVTRSDFLILYSRIDELQKATTSSLLDIHGLLLDSMSRRHTDKE
jgi:hypothetical protein